MYRFCIVGSVRPGMAFVGPRLSNVSVGASAVGGGIVVDLPSANAVGVAHVFCQRSCVRSGGLPVHTSPRVGVPMALVTDVFQPSGRRLGVADESGPLFQRCPSNQSHIHPQRLGDEVLREVVVWQDFGVLAIRRWTPATRKSRRRGAWQPVVQVM